MRIAAVITPLLVSSVCLSLYLLYMKHPPSPAKQEACRQLARFRLVAENEKGSNERTWKGAKNGTDRGATKSINIPDSRRGEPLAAKTNYEFRESRR